MKDCYRIGQVLIDGIIRDVLFMKTLSGKTKVCTIHESKKDGRKYIYPHNPYRDGVSADIFSGYIHDAINSIRDGYAHALESRNLFGFPDGNLHPIYFLEEDEHIKTIHEKTIELFKDSIFTYSIRRDYSESFIPPGYIKLRGTNYEIEDFASYDCCNKNKDAVIKVLDSLMKCAMNLSREFLKDHSNEDDEYEYGSVLYILKHYSSCMLNLVYALRRWREEHGNDFIYTPGSEEVVVSNVGFRIVQSIPMASKDERR